MDTKKISFGFNKITKKPILVQNKQNKAESKVELIKCLEGQEIKLMEEKKELAPLVIPMKDNQKTSAALASLITRRAVLLGEELPEQQAKLVLTAQRSPVVKATNGERENLEQKAARELLSDLEKQKEADVDANLVLPLVKADELPLDGAKESCMSDYESIPIEQYGLALLRGMGWIEPPTSTKKNGTTVDDTPFVRPKGMGLGADKAVKAKPLLVAPAANEVLEIKKQAFVRILGGKNKDLYGQIEGFDDHVGRVIVKMAIGGAKETLNEFLCQPVSRSEYSQYGKCINSTKYEEYKRMENEHGQIIIKKEETKEKLVKREIQDCKEYTGGRQSQLKSETYSKDEKKYKPETTRYHDDDRKPTAHHNSHFSSNRSNVSDEYKQKRRSRTPTKFNCRSLGKDSYTPPRDFSRTSRLNERKSQARQRKSRPKDRRSDSKDNRSRSRRSPSEKRYTPQPKLRDEDSSSRSKEYRCQRTQEEDYKSQSTSSRKRYSSSDTSKSSSESESDADSAYGRRHHSSKKKKSYKKSSSKVNKKKKSKKSKSSKHKSRKRDSSKSSLSDGSHYNDSDREDKKHKKKTKKSKRERSRSHSRDK